ncbi:amino acid ABC transporter permease [Mesorhizobium sp. ANAO-SY3R2]|uniref:amino acid ABC transporter permease n=1 Tax=Mesorhizobium sp. ANAO-SY3R2 TaxID=3166644 RepID=UPI00366B682C
MTIGAASLPALEPPPQKRRIAWVEVPVFVAILACFVFLGWNIYSNMRAAGIQPGFSFLWQQAGFDISESLIAYSANDTYLRAIAAGVLNTLLVAIASLVLACAFGLAVGLVSVSSSPVARVLALGYVELFRNLPKILVLLVIYIVAVNGLPAVRQAIQVGPLLISNRAIYFPWIEHDPLNVWSLGLSLILVMALATLWVRHATKRQALTGKHLPVWRVIAPLAVVMPLIIAWLVGAPRELSWPELQGFAIRGGGGLSIQFCAVAISLGLYHGAQIAEVIRGGIEAIPKGQIEAAKALGLRSGQTTNLIVVPQVLRMIVPPLNNQFVNLFKNTSIAIAVGYSDLMSVAGTTINQTFRPLEIMLVTMSIYLVFCLMLASSLNYWSDRIRAREGRAGR